ncbi:MAG: PAS domain S-box protein, partial [Cytophagales bacterium]
MLTKEDSSEIEILKAEIASLKSQLNNLKLFKDNIEVKGVETALSKSEDLIQLVNENTHDLIFIHDMEGNILGVNKVVTEFLASSQKKNMRDLLAPEVKPKFDDYLQRIAISKEEKGYMKVIDRQGNRRILKYHNRLVESSEVTIIHGLAHDITDLWNANKKLKASEESYRGLFDSSEDPIFILDKNGVIINANTTAQEIFNHSVPLLEGELFERICLNDPSYKVVFGKLLKRTIEGRPQKMEVYESSDTNKKPVFREITLRTGNYLGNEVIIAYFRDITERKIAEQKLREETAERESEKRLQKVFDHVNLFVFSIDSLGTIKYSNSTFPKISGTKKETLIGSDFFSYFETDNDFRPGKDFNSFDETKLLQRFEARFVSKYGDVRTVLFNSVMIAESHGRIGTLTLVGEDITDSTRVIRALRETNKKLQDLFDNAYDLIVLFDTEYKINFTNNAWRQALGYTEEETENLKFIDIIADDHKESTLDILDRISKGEKIETFDTVFKSKTGRVIYVVGSVNCRYLNEKPVEFRAIFYDNTYKVRAERAQNLYYSIANLAIKSDNLDELYIEIHKLLKKYIEVNNFHVALYDLKDKNILNFPYYVDEHMPGLVTSNRRRLGRGLTEYSLTLSQPVFLYDDDIIRLAEERIIEPLERVPKIWMGVPLKVENRTIGIIAVKSYSDRNKYRNRHLEMLDFVSGQIAIAIERKLNEEKIAKQSARLKAIFESSSHLIWSINKKQELTSFNQNYEQAIFYHHGSLPKLDTPVVEPRLLLSSEKFRAQINQWYKEAFEGKPQHYETYIEDKNGGLIWRETYLNPIYSNDGTIEEVSGITHDITEKKNTELALRLNEEKFRNIFESFQDIYYRTDFDGNITLISPSVIDTIQYSPEEMIGRNISSFYSNPKRKKKFFKELLVSGSVKNFEVDLVRKDGTLVPTISNIRIIYDENKKPIAIDGVARDITDLKRASEELLKAKEVAEKSLKVKELFLANMSHEIRTPMNGIIGVIDLLSETQLHNDQRDYINTIKKSSETLLTILNDILDLSKLEAGKMQLRVGPTDIRDTIEKLHTLFLQKANSKGISFFYEIDENVPQYLKADETRLLQVLSNLTSNAIKFTEKGSVSILVKKLKHGEKKSTYKVEVKDTGIGMAQESINLLFDSFSQLDNTSSKSYGGTGLGLAISKQLCKLMGGEIGVNSE